jgi:uncharacterized protein (DUF1800 family)
MTSTEAFVAAGRFGLGASPGELELIAQRDPQAYLERQLLAPDPAVASRLAGLPGSAALVQRFVAARGEEDKGELKQMAKGAFVDEHATHLQATAGCTMPLRERLVAFWANHLAISIERKEVTSLAASYEREVVRAHLDGKFEDMLLASARHPAMLAYLDNAKSVGPSSMVGRRRGKGLNENYARELLELHTVGVGGGYVQADVEALARLLTGWTVTTEAGMGYWPMGAEVGTFAYRAERHEPGSATVMSRSYTDAASVLPDLAAHPATARFLATKLARAFVSDDPPESAVRALQRAWSDSGGHLPTVHRALVALPEAWAEPLAKVKSPWDLVLSTARLLGITDGQLLLASLKELGQVPYAAPSPQGWPDRAEAWLSPGSLLDRLEWAQRVSRQSSGQGAHDAVALASDVLGPVLSSRTRRALQSAPPREALALLLSSPEFQRR